MADGIAGQIRRGRHPAVLHTRLRRKNPSVRTGCFTCLMPGSLWPVSTTDKTKGPVFRQGPSLLFDAWQFMNHFVIHPSGRCCATFKSCRFCPTLCRVVNCLKGQCHTSNLMPGSSLLSHGETPHYHRRYGVSLLSSAWGQVGPPRYGRQANSLCSVLCLLH